MDGESPWRKLHDSAFFKKVLINLMDFHQNAKDNPDVFVRFGNNGKGIRPNYQLEAPGRTSARRGDNHKPDSRALDDRYEENELSPERLTVTQLANHVKSLLPG